FEITSSQHLNEISIYEGWRSLYKIIGSFLQNQGIYAFHLYHEKLEWRGKNSSSNIELAKLKALDYAKKKRVPLVFDKELPVQIVIGYNPHLYNNQILSTLPNPLFIDENTNILSDDFVELILNYNPEAII